MHLWLYAPVAVKSIGDFVYGGDWCRVSCAGTSFFQIRTGGGARSSSSSSAAD